MYSEYKSLDLRKVALDVANDWQRDHVFLRSIEQRDPSRSFTFYEGPPSANGMPGIHHVLGRTIKDIFCRYKALKGHKVLRKGGWDTHGLPVELQVEKRLGISKDDIGKKISIEEYNIQCRNDVMRYKDVWENLTRSMGYWVDLDKPYITYQKDYIESLWHIIKVLFDKGLIYRGYTIQPYSPAAGTGLSSHELNQTGTYRMVKDISCTAQFKVLGQQDLYLLAWTTTPWTLPSNSALAIGANIAYATVATVNPYTLQKVRVVLAKDLIGRYFMPEGEGKDVAGFKKNDKVLPYKVESLIAGNEMIGWRYEQLLDYVVPQGNAFRVIAGDFVTIEEGTGIVHIAPTFGADDLRVAQANGVPAVTVPDPLNPDKELPLVDRSGKFVPQMGEFGGRYVKNYTDDPSYVDVNLDICVKLKQENKAFRVEKYEHNYPHCWRTDKPILYYPLEAWFIRTTAYKDKMVEINNKINWKPAHTGSGRFGNWLENLVDWNLSRTRFWGTPLPIWATDDGVELLCIGSMDQLKREVNKAVETGYMHGPLSQDFDLHRPFVDGVVLVSPQGKPMHRVPDVIDVWFDSGAMPYAQWHYPFENQELFAQNFPADFIAEGVDQTRGWFFTLHALAAMLFDSVAFKNVIANGLVLDKEGNKMSKRLGNAIDPFATIEQYGPDALRWYMVHNAQPWDNLKFDLNGVDEVRKKFFGTLHNTYQFFALYANLDHFSFAEPEVPVNQRPEIDRWILSELHTLIEKVDEHLDAYEPTKAIRPIQEFTLDNLSNWYVRLCRRRFWKGEYGIDKVSAFQTLYTCLETIARLAAPFAPFYADRLFSDLNQVTKRFQVDSVHLGDFPKSNPQFIDSQLEARMNLAQNISSLGLALRKKAGIRVRQPLQRLLLPALNPSEKVDFERIRELVSAELNVKEIELVDDDTMIVTKSVKPNFKVLGPRLGTGIKHLKTALESLGQREINDFEQSGKLAVPIGQETIELELHEVEIASADIPGWLVASAGKLVVALDVHMSRELELEGLAREVVSKVQALRKSSGLEVTDRITITLREHPTVRDMVQLFANYICTETLASQLDVDKDLSPLAETFDVEGFELALTISPIQYE
ncbi:MAG: isoleucine--tRNA ligase [Bacteroidetes bacterium]|nr:isoleucine--tRNA ligase [Bacteroidota bacterium]